uniref:MADF domain-containing protein n=1 Tax=Timema genevievae TaxID=629358 RepID=A0A7R9JXJ1_TIMGE|nr:unnamed protein product [Timema genevievae]
MPAFYVFVSLKTCWLAFTPYRQSGVTNIQGVFTPDGQCSVTNIQGVFTPDGQCSVTFLQGVFTLDGQCSVTNIQGVFTPNGQFSVTSIQGVFTPDGQCSVTILQGVFKPDGQCNVTSIQGVFTPDGQCSVTSIQCVFTPDGQCSVTNIQCVFTPDGQCTVTNIQSVFTPDGQCSVTSIQCVFTPDGQCSVTSIQGVFTPDGQCSVTNIKVPRLTKQFISRERELYSAKRSRPDARRSPAHSPSLATPSELKISGNFSTVAACGRGLNCRVMDTLISKVFLKPEIWDKRRKEYSNRVVVDGCWRDISKEMGVEEGALRRKWKYLRYQFSVQLGNIRPPRSVDPGDSTYDPKWPHYKSLASSSVETLHIAPKIMMTYCFFRSLLPYISKIPSHLKLRFRNKIQEVVEKFAFPSGQPTFQYHQPECLMSPTTVLSIQEGYCFEYSTLLVSFLIGSGYDAYVVSGYATREFCNNDQSMVDCPHLLKELEHLATILVLRGERQATVNSLFSCLLSTVVTLSCCILSAASFRCVLLLEFSYSFS